uniref:Uncharacterized protein n=1 Tax=Anguilla anguilla TaxID=7936 RepID=A0A0E9TRF6_ANGAN
MSHSAGFSGARVSQNNNDTRQSPGAFAGLRKQISSGRDRAAQYSVARGVLPALWLTT